MKSGGGFSAVVQGHGELQSKLRSLPRRVENQISRKAMREGAKVILLAAKSYAPVDTGLLKKSLKVRAAKRKKNYIGFVVQTKAGDYKGETYYGSFIEYGHKLGSRKLGDKRSEVPEQPYLKPAFEDRKDYAIQVIGDVMRKGLEEEAIKK